MFCWGAIFFAKQDDLREFDRTERPRIMKFQHLTDRSSGGPCGPTLVTGGTGTRSPDQRPRTKEKSYDLLNHGNRGALPSETVRRRTQVVSSVVSKAGALARKSVPRAMAVVVVSAGVVPAICGGSI